MTPRRPSPSSFASLLAAPQSPTELTAWYRGLAGNFTASLFCLVACAPNPGPGSAPPQAAPAMGHTPTSLSGALPPQIERSGVAPASGTTTSGTTTSGTTAAPSKSELAAQTCPAVINQPAATGQPCGKLDCLAFGDGRAALAYVLAQKSPAVLAVGEAHLQKDKEGLESSTTKFAALLPTLCSTAKHLVIELWLGRNDCGDQRVSEVKAAQKPVTSAQASGNQNDFVALGFAAKQVGMEPHGLVPTCEQYQDILHQGSEDVSRMLEVIATSTAEATEKLLSRYSRDKPGPIIIAYGGAMHNDASPQPGFEAMSFFPRLEKFTGGRTTELDLVLREQVGTTSSWTSQRWYSAYRPDIFPKHHLVYRTGENSFALVFPRQTPP